MWRDMKMVPKVKASQRQPAIPFPNLYTPNNKLWMIRGWRKAGAMKNNDPFSDSVFELL